MELIICDDLCDNSPDILVGKASFEKTSRCLQCFPGLSLGQTLSQTFSPTLSAAFGLSFSPTLTSGTLGFVIEYLTFHNFVHFLSELLVIL